MLVPVAEPFAVGTERPFVVLVVGVNGAGKTTLIGKLAAKLGEQGFSVLLAAGDTFRAAAIEQLTAWGERNAVPVIAQRQGADSASVIYDAIEAAKARDIDVVLADTAGRLQAKLGLMAELNKIKRVMGRLEGGAPHEVLLVLDAGVGQNALSQVAEFDKAVGVTSLAVTKLDGTAKAGVILAVAAATGLPVRYLGDRRRRGRSPEPSSRDLSWTRFSQRPKYAAVPGIEFSHVVMRYDNGTEALRDVSLEIPEGSMVFLSGHSGAGKSTFLRLVLRLESLTRGRILINDVDISGLARRHIPAYRRHLGVVFQDHQLLPMRSVYDNVALPLRVARTGEREIGRRVRAALSSVELLDKERVLPGALSAGERQRVGIARAVVNRPKVLLADEPTGNLDPALSRNVMSLFRVFKSIGATVIVASHDTALIADMGERIVELADGRVVSDRDA